LPSCGVEDFSWELSTASTVSSFAGAPFAEGLDAPGRLVAGWDDWPPITPSPDDPTGACNWLTGRFLGEALNGPGGIMFDRIRLPHLRVAVRPGKRTVERGERARFAATVRNTGNGTATDVYACVAVPREAIMVRPRVPDHLNFNALARCLRVGVMAPGDVQRVEFNPKARARSRRGTYRLGFHAIGDGVASGFHGARMTVK
jgi:hypothetical protein